MGPTGNPLWVATAAVAGAVDDAREAHREDQAAGGDGLRIVTQAQQAVAALPGVQELVNAMAPTGSASLIVSAAVAGAIVDSVDESERLRAGPEIGAVPVRRDDPDDAERARNEAADADLFKTR